MAGRMHLHVSVWNAACMHRIIACTCVHLDGGLDHKIGIYFKPRL